MPSISTLALLSTVFCFAINAYTFRIAYPLWRHVPPPDFPAVHHDYLRRLTPVITLPHVAMFFSNAILVLRPVPWLPRYTAIAVFLLTTLVILLSAFLAVPVHSRFQRNKALDQPGLDRLIRVSAIRTVLMTTATALLFLPLAKLFI